MKFILLIPAVLFSTLFYNKSLGLNVLLFALVVITLLFLRHQKKSKNKSILLKALLYLISSVFVFIHHNDLTLTATVISFFVFVGSFSNTKSSLFIQFLNGFYTTITAVIANYFERVEQEVVLVKEKNTNYAFWFKTVSISIVVLAIFMGLYSNSNPVFANLLQKIDLSFISFNWILFTAVAYYFIANIVLPVQIEPLTTSDANTTDFLIKIDKNTDERTLSDNAKLGFILFLVLNFLLVFVLVTDLIYLLQKKQLSAAALSNQLHQGVNALIVSIVLAIVLILFFFKGDLNFYKGNKHLKKSVFVWLVMNGFLAVVTAYKNYQYVHFFGLTYKRIGVFVYLILAIFGLILTFIKVKEVKNLWFLVRKNTQIAFSVLLIAAAINWDTFITKYNVFNAKEVDVTYLISLDNNKIVLDNVKKQLVLTPTQLEEISTNKAQYQSELREKVWQEYFLTNFINK